MRRSSSALCAAYSTSTISHWRRMRPASYGSRVNNMMPRHPARSHVTISRCMSTGSGRRYCGSITPRTGASPSRSAQRARSARCEGNHIQDRAAADDVLGIADLDPLCGISEIGGADR